MFMSIFLSPQCWITQNYLHLVISFSFPEVLSHGNFPRIKSPQQCEMRNLTKTNKISCVYFVRTWYHEDSMLLQARAGQFFNFIPEAFRWPGNAFWTAVASIAKGSSRRAVFQNKGCSAGEMSHSRNLKWAHLQIVCLMSCDNNNNCWQQAALDRAF